MQIKTLAHFPSTKCSQKKSLVCLESKILIKFNNLNLIYNFNVSKLYYTISIIYHYGIRNISNCIS